MLYMGKEKKKKTGLDMLCIALVIIYIFSVMFHNIFRYYIVGHKEKGNNN